MVELTEIKEEGHPFEKDAQEVRPGTTYAEAAAGEETSDEDSSDDEYDEDETLYERLCALKDIVAPKQRQVISNVFNTTVSTLKSAFSNGGNLVWAVTTSALLLGVPLSLSILAEQQLIEMEKSFDLQKDANDILAQGETAPAPSQA
ncbi:LAFE_0F05688g1_1 [Lachancea fermentati]|uniref:LAFE_0F05688g1_1 n=1 Tax=Lachancea fermentati TaxID=4955 RepID=A0A1G4MEQ1_LACFM|nr:LAFE_0F05688g1_1 [Lachancea fermentati]